MEVLILERTTDTQRYTLPNVTVDCKILPLHFRCVNAWPEAQTVGIGARLTLVRVMLNWMVRMTTRMSKLPSEISVKVLSEYHETFFNTCERETHRLKAAAIHPDHPPKAAVRQPGA